MAWALAQRPQQAPRPGCAGSSRRAGVAAALRPLLLPPPGRRCSPPPPAAAARNEPGARGGRCSGGGAAAAAGAAALLQGVELAAVSLAAACQAAALAGAAAVQAQAALGQQAPEAAASARAAPARRQAAQVHASVAPLPPPGPWPGLAAAVGGGQVQGAALLVALMCGVALRYLQRPGLLAPGGSPSADAAVRLVALEAVAAQQAGQVATLARHLDKLQARVRVATGDLKAPLRAAQGSAAQAAEAMAALAAQQAAQQRQLDGATELIAALQGVAAKQFKVSADALQQLRQGQAALGATTGAALARLQQQQADAQRALDAAQQRIAALDLQCLSLQQQHHFGGTGGSTAGGSDAGSDGSAAPDPWRAAPARGGNGAAAALAAAGGGSGDDGRGDVAPSSRPRVLAWGGAGRARRALGAAVPTLRMRGARARLAVGEHGLPVGGGPHSAVGDDGLAATAGGSVGTMAAIPSALVWECVKGHNSFVRKNLNGAIFSAEPGNLYNKHSYKYSGVANAKTVDITAEGDAVKVSKKRSKTAQQPAKGLAVSASKKPGRRVLKAVAKDVGSYRPDLKAAAVARASAVLKSLRVKKAAAKAQ
ncbi:RPL28A [Scenedesmus sp. PABB004]|nr:RPL28A [Scenedesmus sp. PABB004]